MRQQPSRLWMLGDLFADSLVEFIDRSLQVRVQDQQRSSSLAGMRSQRQRSECLLANSAPERVAQPQAAIQRHGLRRVLDSGSQAHPLMTVPQQHAQISLLGEGIQIVGKRSSASNFRSKRIPPIMLLLPCLRLADFLGMAHAAFDPRLFHQLQEPLHRAGRFNPQNRTTVYLARREADFVMSSPIRTKPSRAALQHFRLSGSALCQKSLQNR
jgi:hypothetical protein